MNREVRLENLKERDGVLDLSLDGRTFELNKTLGINWLPEEILRIRFWRRTAARSYIELFLFTEKFRRYNINYGTRELRKGNLLWTNWCTGSQTVQEEKEEEEKRRFNWWSRLLC
jgi:hypothetical protein